MFWRYFAMPHEMLRKQFMHFIAVYTLVLTSLRSKKTQFKINGIDC